MKRIAITLASTSVFLVGLIGCGSDGAGTSKPQQKTAAITFSTVSSAHAAPLQGIHVAIKLPAGATVADMATALTGTNSSGRVTPGTFSPADGTATFAVSQTNFAPPLNFISFGDFATLTCNITSGVTLDQSSFSLTTSDIILFGKDANGDSVDLANQIPVKLSVSFGN